MKQYNCKGHKLESGKGGKNGLVQFYPHPLLKMKKKWTGGKTGLAQSYPLLDI